MVTASKLRELTKVAAIFSAAQWNERHPIGTPVTVTRDNGDKFETTTRSEAWVLNAHAMVMVNGISGGYLLSRVVPRETP
jgi:hypothetical protein